MASEEHEVDAFGYQRDDKVKPAVSVEAIPGMGVNTLEPVVIVYFRQTVDAEQVGHAIPPDVADVLTEQLREAAEQARREHFA